MRWGVHGAVAGDGTPSMDIIESNGRLLVAGLAASTWDMMTNRAGDGGERKNKTVKGAKGRGRREEHQRQRVPTTPQRQVTKIARGGATAMTTRM